MSAYTYDPPVYRGPFGMTPRALMADQRWHDWRTAELAKMDHLGQGAFSTLVSERDHPTWVTSKRGGLIHRVEFVTWTYCPGTYGDEIAFHLVCGQIRGHRNIVAVPGQPAEICHLCHDRHWLKTGEHLPALPQSGCELTRGTAYVSNRTYAVRKKTNHQGATP